VAKEKVSLLLRRDTKGAGSVVLARRKSPEASPFAGSVCSGSVSPQFLLVRCGKLLQRRRVLGRDHRGTKVATYPPEHKSGRARRQRWVSHRPLSFKSSASAVAKGSRVDTSLIPVSIVMT
jgi:hypothetical protein